MACQVENVQQSAETIIPQDGTPRRIMYRLTFDRDDADRVIYAVVMSPDEKKGGRLFRRTADRVTSDILQDWVKVRKCDVPEPYRSKLAAVFEADVTLKKLVHRFQRGVKEPTAAPALQEAASTPVEVAPTSTPDPTVVAATTNETKDDDEKKSSGARTCFFQVQGREDSDRPYNVCISKNEDGMSTIYIKASKGGNYRRIGHMVGDFKEKCTAPRTSRVAPWFLSESDSDDEDPISWS